MSATVITAADVEVFLAAGAILAEGPVWDDRRQQLWWVDITAGQVHRASPAAGGLRARDEVVAELRCPVGSVAMTEDDRLVVAAGQDLMTLHPDGSISQLVAIGRDVAGGVLNDCGCDPEGRLWVGVTTETESEPIGCLRTVSPALEVSTVLTGLTVPNGVDWSPDGRLMYFADSPSGHVQAFAFNGGRLGRPVPLTQDGAGQGLPDGLTVDSEGGIWVAYWDGWRVERRLPDGSLDMLVELPAAQVTSCAFGGPQLRDLFITTAAHGLGAAERASQPSAGSIFRVRPGVTGLPARRFPLA